MADGPITPESAMPKGQARGIEVAVSPEDLKSVGDNLRNSLTTNNLLGRLYEINDRGEKLNVRGRYGIPGSGGIKLKGNQEGLKSGYTSFSVSEDDGSIFVSQVPDLGEAFGYGLDTDTYAWETLIISPSGKISREINGHPTIDPDEIKRGVLQGGPNYYPHAHSDSESLEIMKGLQDLVNEGVVLKKQGKLTDKYPKSK
ncbi:MAG: hypothetical protein Q8P26_00140 [Candidatus Levybacteria bacterium]|nr:hypothetical protein [Candidatus Levybacteria bacterium]